MLKFSGTAIPKTKISFVIPGKPVPKQGSSSSHFATADGAIHAHHYTPKHVANWAAYARLVASQYAQNPLWGSNGEGIRVTIVVKKIRPKSSKRKYFTTTPDLDNVEKNLMDAIKGIIFVDDAMVIDKHSSKTYSDVEQTEVTVELIP
jgi:Holliday junction resolvase RusA-like endonuclease